MKKRILTFILALTLSISAASTSIFAAETSDKPFIYFSFGDNESAQVSDSRFPVHEVSKNAPAVSMTTESALPWTYLFFDENSIYEVTEAQFNELCTKGNLDEVVARDGLTALPDTDVTSVTAKENVCTQPSAARTKGSWDITSNSIRPGYTTTYSMPGGGSFQVAAGERIDCYIIPDSSCYITMGVTGTVNKEYTAYVDVNSTAGVQAGSTNPGSYKFYVKNDQNDFTITVHGYVDIY